MLDHFIYFTSSLRYTTRCSRRTEGAGAPWILTQTPGQSPPMISILQMMTTVLVIQVIGNSGMYEVQGDQLNMAVFFWFLFKKWLVQCTLLYTCTLNKSLLIRYQKNKAMFNWSPCTWSPHRRYSFFKIPIEGSFISATTQKDISPFYHFLIGFLL